MLLELDLNEEELEEVQRWIEIELNEIEDLSIRFMLEKLFKSICDWFGEETELELPLKWREPKLELPLEKEESINKFMREMKG